MQLDFTDEVLCEHLNHVISGLLPHENYSPETFGLLYPTLTTTLAVEDVKGLYFIVYTVFDKYFSLQNAMNAVDFKVRITRERFSSAVSNNLPDLILEPQTMVSQLMTEEGKPSDITIPTVQQEVMGILYGKVMELYDTCFDIASDYESSLSRIVDLQDSIKANLIETGLGMQHTIMATGLKYGRKSYRGPAGWLEFSQQLTREVSELGSKDDGDLVCSNLDILSNLDEANDELNMALANYGIPQLDDATPMLRHRLMVLVAKENTGKTKVITHLVASLIRAGVKPFVACGEAPKGLMFNSIVSSYIYQEYGMHFEGKFLTGAGYLSLSDEDKQLVNTAKARVSMSGLVISNDLEYDTVLAKFTHYYHMGCEAFFIDHTQSLRGRKGRKIGDLVTGLALDCREFKNSYPVYVCMASQPSTNLKDLLQKEQTTDIQSSPTAQSAAPSQEADELFILNETDFLKKQGLLAWITYKRRGAAKPPTFYIKKLFHVSAYEYDAKYQGANTLDSDEMDGMIKAIGTQDDDIDADDDDMTLDF